jgi:hypothetical protein
MLGIPVRYFLKHPVTTVTDVAADPLQLWMTIQDEYAAQREGSRAKYQYEFDANWEQRLHESLEFGGPVMRLPSSGLHGPGRTASWKRKGLSPVRRVFNGRM